MCYEVSLKKVSNLRPVDYKSTALPAELFRHVERYCFILVISLIVLVFNVLQKGTTIYLKHKEEVDEFLISTYSKAIELGSCAIEMFNHLIDLF